MTMRGRSSSRGRVRTGPLLLAHPTFSPALSPTSPAPTSPSTPASSRCTPSPSPSPSAAEQEFDYPVVLITAEPASPPRLPARGAHREGEGEGEYPLTPSSAPPTSASSLSLSLSPSSGRRSSPSRMGAPSPTHSQAGDMSINDTFFQTTAKHFYWANGPPDPTGAVPEDVGEEEGEEEGGGGEEEGDDDDDEDGGEEEEDVTVEYGRWRTAEPRTDSR